MTDDVTDWDLLNAYADNELSEAERKTLDQRLKNEPELQAQLDDINYAKNAMTLLRVPQIAVDNDKLISFPQKSNRVKKWAVAASVALCLLGGSALYYQSLDYSFEQAALDSHQSLADKSYAVDVSSVQSVAWGPSHFGLVAPDLSGAQLYLVDVQTAAYRQSEKITMHYRGLRGCSLSVVALSEKDATFEDNILKTSQYLNYKWEDKGFKFVVLTKGMDAKRFQTVSSYAQNIMRQQLHNDEDQFASLKYNKNSPCA